MAMVIDAFTCVEYEIILIDIMYVLFSYWNCLEIFIYVSWNMI